MVKYSEWVGNIVPVPKKDGKVRMCVDYRDLNKASLKDNFLLPHIDTLVDNTAGYSLLSFMDSFFGYNQIKMHPEEMEKTTFAVKGSAIADFLASRALEDYEPLNFDFPNEGLMYVVITEEDSQEGHHWKLNFDGASNAIGNGIGAVLVSPNGDHYPFTNKLDFDDTKNMAEYEACIMGICAAIECKVKILEVCGDSSLVIYQLKDEWEMRDPKLISYQKLVLELIKEFDDITFCYLSLDENQMADALATLASMIKVNKQVDIKPIQMSIYETLAHYYNIKEEENDDCPWYQDILRYVKNREYPDQTIENDKRTLRRLANDYVLDGEIL
ncbi:uncharacterized protein LOC105775277 [Gossypium raimondii]|uniref:uncharacterized protein LOC105775277 n=1 Tax=Gossypium raimondii TaxID=29730 RepID=UPI00063AAAD3|nr:uncharacterized protein LOC105775277 [Gossypium raimondii]